MQSLMKGLGEYYLVEGVRFEYKDLPGSRKKLIKAFKKKLVKDIFGIVSNKRAHNVIDDGVKISIRFTRRGIDHFCNDVLLTLSGMYFDEESMKSKDTILSNANYVQTSHEKIHYRTDGRDLWFAYLDSEGRGVYFKVCFNKNIKGYEFYSAEKELKIK